MPGRDGIALTDIVHLDEDNNVIREVSEDAFVFFRMRRTRTETA